MKWLRYLALLPQLVGFVRGILELVRTAEDLLAGGQRGAEKKALVVDLLTAAVNLGDALGIRAASESDVAELRAAATVAIDTVVAVLNATGVFKHSAPGPDRG